MLADTWYEACTQPWNRLSSQLQKQGVCVCFTLPNLHPPFLNPHNTSLSHRPHCDSFVTTRQAYHQTPFIDFFAVMISHKPGNMVFFHRWISVEWMSNVVHLSEVGRPLNFDCIARAVSTASIHTPWSQTKAYNPHISLSQSSWICAWAFSHFSSGV